MSAEDLKLVLTVFEASQLLGISKGLAYQLAREGKFPGAIKLGGKRIIVSRARLLAWLNHGEGDNGGKL